MPAVKVYVLDFLAHDELLYKFGGVAHFRGVDLVLRVVNYCEELRS